MVLYDDLMKLGTIGQESLSLPAEELVGFVKDGAVRAYKAGEAGRDGEDVSAEFDAKTKELRLVVRKTVVTDVKDHHKECEEAVGNVPVGQTAEVEVSDVGTYQAIDAAYSALKEMIGAEWKKKNAVAIKTKYQEIKQKCVPASVSDKDGKSVIVSLPGSFEGVLPEDQQLNEKYELGTELAVYVQKLEENGAACNVIVSRADAALVPYTMRRHIPEVETGHIEVKAVGRIAGKRSRAAVWSKDFSAIDRCNKRAEKVSADLAGEQVDFIEWYEDIKAYIASALKVEARDVHVIEAEKQAIVDVLADSAEQGLDQGGTVIKLAQQLTGYKIDVKLVPRDGSEDLPGI